MIDDRTILSSSTDVSNKRQALIQFIWGSAGFPGDKLPSEVKTNVVSPFGELNNLERVDEIYITMDADQKGMTYHFIPAQRKNNRLVILHQGHGCILDSNAANFLLNEGYAVLAMFMPRFGPQDCIGDHEALFNIATTGSPMKFFFEPVAVSLNYLKTQANTDNFPQYEEFHMAGLSGGGWTATVYAAIDPTIKFSFQVAGTIPLYLRFNGSIGDIEQTLDAFYQIAGYPDLYVMGSYGFERKQVQVLNRRDDCCFGEAQHDSAASGLSYDQAMRDVESRVRQVMFTLGLGTFRLEIDEAAPQHIISDNTLVNVILSELNHDRRYISASASAEAFVRGMNGDLWYFEPARWVATGLAIVGVPAVLRDETNNFNIFFRDPSNQLKHAFGTESGWTIQDLPGDAVITNPVAVSWGTGRIDVAAFGRDYRLYHWWRSAGSTFNIEQVSGNTLGLGMPALVTWGVDRLDIFFKGSDRALYHASSNGSTPWAIERPGGIILGSPSAVTTGGDTLRVYVRGQSGQLWEARQTNGGSWNWTSLSAAAGSTATLLSGSPSASAQHDAVKVFARTSTGSLASFSLSIGAMVSLEAMDLASTEVWSFTDHGGIITGSPTATPGGAFVRGRSGGLWLFNGTGWTHHGGLFD
jgi:hypothetical protein